MSLFEIRETELKLDEVVAAVSRPQAGGIAVFVGTVRSENAGLPVTLLEYQAYASMAVKEMARIGAEISAEIPDAYIDCLKWTLRVKPFAQWDNLMRLNQIEVGNHCVRNGLLHYTIYWYHLRENRRPDPGSAGLAIKALF